MYGETLKPTSNGATLQPGTAASVTITPTTLAFSPCEIGAIGHSEDLSVMSTGERPFLIKQVTLEGSHASDFRIVTNPSAAGRIAPGTSFRIGVEFLPSDVGWRLATLSIATDPSGDIHPVLLKGKGEPEQVPVNGAIGSAVVAYCVILTLFLLGSLVQLWTSLTPTGTSSGSGFVTIHYFGWTFKDVPGGLGVLLVTMVCGAIGALVRALRSISWYVGNRHLVRSWLAFYVLLPFVGATLSLVFYLVIRGGFFSPQSTIAETNPFGFAALGTLVGLFSEQAVLKLKDVAETMLTKPPSGKDASPQQDRR